MFLESGEILHNKVNFYGTVNFLQVWIEALWQWESAKKKFLMQYITSSVWYISSSLSPLLLFLPSILPLSLSFFLYFLRN